MPRKKCIAERSKFPTGAFGGGVGTNFQPPHADTTTAQLQPVAILGHSYAAHLFREDTFQREPFIFYKLAQRGATLESIQRSAAWERLRLLRPRLTFIILGGNDIQPQAAPRDIAQGIESIARRVEDITSRPVVILTVENRLRPRGIEPAQYKTIKNGVNRWLRSVLHFTKPRCRPCLVMDHHLHDDGVHLNDEGNDAFLENIYKIANEEVKGGQ